MEYNNNNGNKGEDCIDGMGMDNKKNKPLFNSILLFDCNNGSYFSDL